MKKRVLSLFLAITLCLSLTPTGALAEESLPEQTVAATQETETPTPAPQKEEPLPEQTVAATQETETPTPAPQKEESLPEQTVAATQETEIPTPVPQKEEPTAPAENGADENASPASPDEKPTENTPAAAEKNSADEEPGKEPAAATGRDESKADGSPSDDDAAKVQNRLVMAAAAGPDEPTMMGQNDLLALADEGQTPANAQNSEGGGIYVSEADTRTEIWCTSKPDSIGRGYDGTTDGSTIPINLTFTDGTNTFTLKEGTGFTAKKTFDSADAGSRTVTVEITLTGETAKQYKLRADEEKFEINGFINKAYPKLNVSLSKTACTVGEKLLPLLSVEGAPEDAEVTYYYLASALKSWAGSSDVEGSEAMPKIDGNTAISEPGTYYVYAKTGETTNYEVERSATAELTVNEAVVEAASVTKPDGTVSGTYKTLPAALNAAQDGDTVKLLANHTTDWDAVDASEEQMAVVKSTITLDLNGKTVDYLVVGEVVPDEAGGILETFYGNLTVVDNIQGSSHGKIIDLEFVQGSLAIQGGQIGDSDEGGLTCNVNSGNATINGGTVLGLEVSEGDTVAVNGGTVYGVTVRDGASVIVSGGSMHEGNWFNDGTLTITGGTFDSVSFRNNGGTIAICGGTFGEITNENASGKIPVMSLLADGYAFYGKDADGKYTVLQDSRKTTLENVKVMDHTDHAFLNGACIACGALTCDKSNNGEEGGCIAHAVWSPYADYPQWRTTHIKTLDELRKKITDGGTNWSEMNPDAANATVTFLSDVTVDKTFLINQYFAQIFLDLNGHTLSGELQDPIITANFSAGNPIIAIRNGTIENTGTGEAIRLEQGRVTLENVNVTGDMAIAYQYVNGSMYTAPFLGGGSFTRICPAANDVGGTWSKQLKDMLGTGCCFLDSAGSRINAEQWFGSDGYSKIKELVNVRVKACDHKDADGKYTLFEDATMSYGSPAKRCTVCGNLCPHDEITEGQNPTCVACGLPIVIKTTNLLGGKDIGPWYYTGLNDAMYEILHVNKGRRPTLELLADTESDSSYEWMTNDYDGIFIDLAGHTLKLTGDQNKASYWVTIQNTSDTHAEVRGTVNVYHKDSRSKLVILDTDNNLTIEEVKFVGDGTAQFAGGSFGKITVPTGKPLASLLVSGYYFADSNSTTGAPAALYDADGTALTELTNVTVKPCSHNEVIYVPADGGAWKCYCGQKTFVASVTKDDTTTLYTDLQEAFKAADGGTVELMANVGDVTVNTEKPFIFDLNGHSIHKLTVNSKITLKDSSEGEGKIVENLIVEAEGLTVGDLLEDGYAFKKSSGMWCSEAEQAGQAVGNVSIWPVPIRSVTAANPSVTVAYGQTSGVTLTATVVPFAEGGTYTCQWYKIGGTVSPLDGATDSTYQLPVDLAAGTYTYRLTATEDGYEKSCDFTVIVTPVSIEGAAVNVQSLTYNGVAQNPTAVVTLGETVLTENKDYTVTAAPQTNVGSYTLTVTGKGNYTGNIENVNWKIEPKTVTNPTINVVPCVYNGSEQKPSVELKDGEAVIPEGEYTVEYSNNVNAGNGTVTITDKDGGNYVVSGSTTFPIEQASINTSNRWIEVRVFNELAKTYEVELQPNLDNILYEQRIEGTFGTITYSLDDNGASTYEDYYELGTAEIKDGKLILPIKNGSGAPGGNYIVTLMLRVESTNFKSFDLPVHIIARDKIVPRLAEGSTVSATDITYGQTLADSTLTVTGSMEAPSFDAPSTIQKIKGTFAWTDGTVRPDKAGDYQAEWTFTPAEGYEEYATATGKVMITVKPAKLTVSVKASRMYYIGKEQIASIIASGQSVDSTPVTFTYSDKVDGNYTSGGPTFTDAGTYTVYYKAEAANHEPATGTFTVTIEPLPISLLSVSSISKTYDGSADVTLTADKLTFFSKTAKTTNIKLPDTAITFTNAQFTKQQADGSYLPSPEVGNGKALSFTMTLTSNNYVFEGKSEGTTSDVFATDDVNRFTITKAAAPTMQPIELTVINGLTKTYLVNLPALPTLGDNCKYGSIKYEVCNFDLIGEGGYANSTAMITSNDEFQLAVPAVESQTEGFVGTVGVKITTDNYQDMLLTVEVIAKNKIVPVQDGEITATPITFGQILRVSTITGTMKDDGKTVEGTFEWKDPSTKPDKAGDYQAEWTFTPAEGYEEYATATGNTTVKVNKAAIPTSAITAPTAQENLTYTGQEQALIIAGIVTDYGTMQYSLTENGTYSQDIPTGTDAGTYIVYYKVVGDENHNDTAPASVAVSIGKKPLTIAGVTAESKPYDGTTNADISSVTFDNVTLNRGTDYTVTANFDDASVGDGKNVTATVTLIDQAAKNYALEQSSFLTTASITKAAAPRSDFHPAVTVINDLAKTYEMLLTDSYLPKLSSPCGYGNVRYSLRGTYLTDGYKDTVQAEVVEENSQYKLKLTVPAVDYDKVSSVGTIDVRVSSDNYQDFYLTIGVKTKNKDVPVPDGTISASNITYGQALNDSKITGKMKGDGKTIDGTFAWKNGVINPNAGSYDAEWVFTPAEGYEEYATATGTATVTVNPKAVTVSITPNGGTYGETITPATVKANDVVGEDTPTITLTYTGTANDGTEYTGTTPPTKAGTYTIKAATTDTNYTLDAKTTTAEFTVAKRRATVTPDNKTKVYEAKDPDLTYAVSGVLDGETLKGITLTRAEGENAGEYAITGKADANANPNYDVKFVEGKFTINPKSIDGATVKLGEGLTANGEEQTQTVDKVMLGDKELPTDSYTVTGNTATNPGSYTLIIAAKGNYTGKIEWTYVIAPAKAEDAPGADIAIDKGTVKLAVKSEGNVPTTTLLTDKTELLAMLVDSGDITADELAQIANGASVDIVLTMKEANVLDEVKAAMAQAAKDYTIGHYLDISLFKYMTVSGSQQAGVALHTTRDALTISVVVPDALINTNSAVIRTYYIVRNHEGTITVLDAAFDAANKTLTFKTDRFSDYAIAYKDTAVPSSGSNPGSNSGSSNSSNDSETKKNEVTAPTPTPTPTPASTSKPSTITAAPQTGDTFHPTLYVVLLVVSLLGLAVVFVCKKRNDK